MNEMEIIQKAIQHNLMKIFNRHLEQSFNQILILNHILPLKK